MSKRQLAMVMDLNKCLGCATCTIACKQLWTKSRGMEYMWWNSVNTMPGKGTPKDWEQMGGGFKNGKALPGERPGTEDFGEAWEFNHKDVFYKGEAGPVKIKGKTPEWGPNWDEDQGDGIFPNAYYFYLPRICNHCTHPACLAACPRKAISKREDDGIVLLDEDRCRGYRYCVEACPYKKIYFNHIKKVSQKCIFCFPRIDSKVAPACARQCPGRVRFLGYKDDAEGPIYKLVEKYKVAVPLHPEYGTEPNVFYIPPLAPSTFDKSGNLADEPRIPDEYLVSLFGQNGITARDNLLREMKKKQGGKESELMDTLIAYKWEEMFGGFDQNPETLTWVHSG